MTLPGLVIGGSSGAGAGRVGMPNVVGTPVVQARPRLEELGLQVKEDAIVADGDAGTVFAQNPAGPSLQPLRRVVTLSVVRKPQVPADLGKKLDDLTTKVDVNELAAQERHEEILDAVGGLSGRGGPDTTPGQRVE